MRFDTMDMTNIMREACEMFGLRIDLAPEHGLHAAEIAGRVSIEGAWQGSVSMGSSQAFARRLAGALHELPAAELDPDLVDDAFGELINVATGHIKALLPCGCSMGLPEDARGTFLDDSDGTVVRRWGFDADGDPLMIVIKAA